MAAQGVRQPVGYWDTFGRLITGISLRVMEPVQVVTIRQARAADAVALEDIDATWTAQVSPSPVPAAGRPFFRPGMTVENVLVAVRGAVIFGYVAVEQSMPLPAHEHALDIGGLAVKPAQHRAGVGRGPVAAAVETARERAGSAQALAPCSRSQPCGASPVRELRLRGRGRATR